MDPLNVGLPRGLAGADSIGRSFVERGTPGADEHLGPIAIAIHASPGRI